YRVAVLEVLAVRVQVGGQVAIGDVPSPGWGHCYTSSIWASSGSLDSSRAACRSTKYMPPRTSPCSSPSSIHFLICCTLGWRPAYRSSLYSLASIGRGRSTVIFAITWAMVNPPGLQDYAQIGGWGG